MAKPRIFISSTYFDLRVVRADLERFCREMGYETILFENGQIPYGKESPLEEDCYREIGSCDIVVAIIGGKYGSESKDKKHSITHRELKTAVDLNKQIYVFVEKRVYNEFETYKANKDVEGFKPISVSDTRVFSILEEIYSLPGGNPVHPFEVSEDIIDFLIEQWAGLFQRLLQQLSREREVKTFQNLQETASTLKQLVTYLSEEKNKGDKTVKEILLSNHPAFKAIKDAIDIPYRVVFHNIRELDALLAARSYYKDENTGDRNTYEWDNKKQKEYIRIDASIFDKNGNLNIFTPEQWDDNWVEVRPLTSNNSDDEIPF